MTDRPMSLWDASSEERDFSAPFAADGRVDVAIVGGGFTGLSAALHAQEAGLTTRVLEAKHIGYGGSGRNVGLVNAAAWLAPQDVRARLGEAYGTRYVERLGEAPAYVFSLIEQHQMRCEATQNGTIHAAHSAAGFEDLRARKAEWDRLGAPVDLLDRDEVASLIGSHAFHGGLVDRRAGTINPMGYCRGLARAARAAGATINTGVRVTGLEPSGSEWNVITDQGALTARFVVLGTNAYTDALWPGLQHSFTPIHYFQLATEPLGERGAAILPQRQGLWDTGKIMFSLRRDAADRILIGSMGTVVGSRDTGLSRRWATRQLARLFPDLGPVDFEEAWHGRIAMTTDHLPHIHELAPGLFTPIGYNGRGITTGTIFGKAMADVLTGTPRDALPLPFSDLKRVPTAAVMSRFYQLGFTANQVVKSL
ncbi:MAG: FAD-binding oxidoreductase [Pseudomonadota bacterium]